MTMSLDQQRHSDAEPFYAPAWLPDAGSAAAETVINAHPAFDRLMARLPFSMRSSFTGEQMMALARASVPIDAPHLLDYRVSVPVLKRRYYVSLLIGRERRSMSRLVQSGQTKRRRIMAAYAVATCSLIVVSVMVILVAALLLKVLLGIDVIEGPGTLSGLLG